MLVVYTFMAVPTAASGDEKTTPVLNSDLVVELEKDQFVPADGGTMPVQLRFYNHTAEQQKFTNTEYRINLLDKSGKQIKGALVFTAELRDIVLMGRSTIDKPGVSLVKGKLKAGEEYFLLVSVRNLVGHHKFTAK